ncbi:helix-turn-helix transcriptional regulator [Pseudomaricurvus alkylphenolicus]|uniref:helix-turn-helix domain-containing protein n=1 Tax=Pseudomaricurvus alkylphenolicus TaxID=1306991 RepID=UPI00142056D9|nr:AraC family transcriptional regulator [Pseudomaricurvus alkylphenolicus]NIB45229.1 helix-turn-helix transcriptional regulator [Pseudomaricurvus alkylphenolicus]
MKLLSKNSSVFLDRMHSGVIDYLIENEWRKTPPQGSPFISYEVMPGSATNRSLPSHADSDINNYIQFMRLSDALFSTAAYYRTGSADPNTLHAPVIKNVMGFTIGTNIDMVSSAGRMKYSKEDSKAYLFSYPKNERTNSRCLVEPQFLAIYFDRSHIERALGMNKESFPLSLRQFYENSQDRSMLMPISLPYSATVLVQDLLLSPMQGALRYHQIASATNYLLLQFIQALINLDTAVDLYADRLDRARRLLMEDFQSRYTLASIAKEVGMGKTKFATEFRAKYGVTATDFRREAQLNEAFRLLKQTNKSISIIAEEAGFSSQNKLSSLFKGRFGMSPRDARKVPQ